MRNTRRAAHPAATWIAFVIGAGVASCAPSGAGPSYPTWTEGTAAYATPLSVPLGNRQAKKCQATVLGSTWALTAAHCFTEAPPDGYARLEGLEMGFAIAQVLVHPLAHRSGAMRVESTWSNDDIRAAHDLALIPLGEELAREPHLGPSHSWDARCMESVGPGVAVEFTAGDTERALTGHGQTLGHTDANALLGNGQMGVMLAVYGARPARGDSGSGLVAQRALLGPEFLACLSQSPMPNQSVLLGVVQNAPSFDDGLPFGVVPLYIPENASWLSRIAGETP